MSKVEKILKDGFYVLENFIENDVIEKWVLELSKNKTRCIERADFSTKLILNHDSLPNCENFLSELNKIVEMKQNFYTVAVSGNNLKDFKKNISKIISTFYHNGKFSYSWATMDVHLQIYQPNHFIKKHDDGLDKNRICILLIPLSKKPEKGLGGDLIMHSNNRKTIVESRVGNVVVLDFTKNNVTHELTRIENWIRTSLIIIVKKA